MNILYDLKSKGKIVLYLCAFSFLEILTNNSQTDNVQQLDTSIDEIYSDRLVAQDILFKISNNVYEQKYLLLDHAPNDSVIAAIHANTAEIFKHLSLYDKTELTPKEAIIFKELKVKVSELDRFSLTGDPLLADKTNKLYSKELDAISNSLGALSEIQMNRGERIMMEAGKVLSFSVIINELNWALLIIISLFMLSILYASRSVASGFHQNERLN